MLETRIKSVYLDGLISTLEAANLTVHCLQTPWPGSHLQQLYFHASAVAVLDQTEHAC